MPHPNAKGGSRLSLLPPARCRTLPSCLPSILPSPPFPLALSWAFPAQASAAFIAATTDPGNLPPGGRPLVDYVVSASLQPVAQSLGHLDRRSLVSRSLPVFVDSICLLACLLAYLRIQEFRTAVHSAGKRKERGEEQKHRHRNRCGATTSKPVRISSAVAVQPVHQPAAGPQEHLLGHMDPPGNRRLLWVPPQRLEHLLERQEEQDLVSP